MTTSEVKTPEEFQSLNSRQRRFCILYATGTTQEEAYKQAGYNSVDPGPQACELMATNATVKAYYNYLIERHAEMSIATTSETVLSSQEKRGILAEIARAQLTDFLDDSGQPSLKKGGPGARAAKEYSTRTKLDREGNPIISRSIKLIDVISAIQEDNKMAGHYAPSKHLVGQYSVSVKLAPKSRHSDDD